MTREEVELPRPRWWPEPITLEQYTAFTPEKLELIDGYLIEGPESTEERRKLLALLLTNCGLEEAAMLSDIDHWREATDRVFGKDW